MILTINILGHDVLFLPVGFQRLGCVCLVREYCQWEEEDAFVFAFVRVHFGLNIWRVTICELLIIINVN